jgi:phosphatidylserine/phosphatidylglycerophosphate/cardiolipin synthase-like enzyme
MRNKKIIGYCAFANLLLFAACAAGGEQNNSETALFRLSFDPAISEKAVVDLIKDARKTIDVSLYGFENSNVASALIEAHQRRGVTVQMSTEFDSESLDGYQKVIAVGIPVRLGNTSGIQHNKYFIVDKKYVVTGSTNLTGSHPPEAFSVSGMWAHYNNLVILKSEGVAAEFQKDFDIQFLGGKYAQAKDAEYNTRFSAAFWPENTYDVGPLKINAYFTPYQDKFQSYGSNLLNDPVCCSVTTDTNCLRVSSTSDMLADCAQPFTTMAQEYCYQGGTQTRVIYHYYNYDKDIYTCSATSATSTSDNYRSALNIVISLFRNAKKSINTLFFAFTDRVLMNELIKAKERGVDVKIYMDYNQYRSQYRNSGKSFINLRQKVGFVKLVRKANGGLNHHKVVFTDDENLILGSMNYSSAAVTSNDENFLLIKNAGAMIAEFKQEQRRIDEQSFLLPPVEDNGSYIPDPGD